MHYYLIEKVLKSLLGEKIKSYAPIIFTDQEQESLRNHWEIFAKYKLIIFLKQIGFNDDSIKLLMLDQYFKENETTLIKNTFFYQLYPIIDILIKIEREKKIEEPEDVKKINENIHKIVTQLSILFENADNPILQIAKYLNKYANRESKHPIIDAFKFNLPNEKINSSHWREVLLHIGPSARIYLPHAARIEEYCNENNIQLPKNKKDLLQTAMKACYERWKEDEVFAKECIKYQIPEYAFDEALDIYKFQGKQKDNFPDVNIHPKEFGGKYYLIKLPMHDKKGFLLGKYTDCCQHIAHEMGKDATILGMTSENSAFYVIYKISNKKGMPDKIIAQSWAWLSTTGSLVFDSWEFLRVSDKKILPTFLDLFAKETQEFHMNGIYLGTSGGTPKKLPYPLATILQKPIDKTGFRDSIEGQYVISQPELIDDLTIRSMTSS